MYPGVIYTKEWLYSILKELNRMFLIRLDWEHPQHSQPNRFRSAQ